MSKVSVIVPVYNAEKTIKETLRSVLAQTFRDLEVVVVDDGSRDASVEEVMSLGDERLKMLRSDHNGVSRARNRGILESSGEFIAFLDADDLWKKDKIEKQLKALEERPDAALAYSWVDRIDENGRILGQAGRFGLSGNLYSHILLVDFLVNGSTPLIRRDALFSAGLFEPSLEPAEDWDLWIRLAEKHEFTAVKTVHVLYRSQGGTASSNTIKLEEAALKVINKAFSRAPASLRNLKKFSEYNIYVYLRRSLRRFAQTHIGNTHTKEIPAILKSKNNLNETSGERKRFMYGQQRSRVME
jgi:glycosyltransferase involved in cell wall biosynthesis